MIPDPKTQSIFVSIASYRDPDCQNTINDLFAKAQHPNRVFVGVCLQVVRDEDDQCLVSLAERPEQLRIDEIPASESLGACWARSRVQALWRGEDYYFQIDSHMRFVDGWDEKLVAMLAKCPAEKPVLSTYPLAFTPPDIYAKDGLVVLRPRGFDESGIVGNSTIILPVDKAPDTPAKSFLIGAGLVFAAGSIVEEVPYDHYIYFEGEEISLAVRLWSKGWDIFTPNQVIAYHDYGKRPARPRHWEDKTDWGVLSLRSKRRVAHLLDAQTTTNPDDLAELQKFGLGTVRSVAEFEAAFDIDFKAHLYMGRPVPEKSLLANQPERAEQRRTVFTKLWANNSWGSPESRSGPGSTMSSTVELRAGLLETFAALNIRILADAGCGDLNWMKELTGSLRLYFGYDIVPELVDDLRSRYADRANCFFVNKDFVMDDLPECDAVLCRDCLTHLPLDAALMALKRFRQSGARFLMATTRPVGRNRWVRAGGWYAMDLTAQPFNFPTPQRLINDSGTKMLGVWDISSLPEH